MCAEVAIRYAGRAGTARPAYRMATSESDYTKCCINTIDLLMMSMYLLETCRGL